MANGMITNEEAWSRARRTIDLMQQRLPAAQHEEDFQGIGLLAREAFISMAQAVYDSSRHPSEDGGTPSETDAKRMLVSFVAAELSGSSKEDARKFMRAAVMFADVLIHKRSAGRMDAQLVLAAIESVSRLISILGNVAEQGEPWAGVEIGGRFFAWSGPTLHDLQDRTPVPAIQELEHALRQAGMTPSYGVTARLHHHFANGRLQVFETDRRSWRRSVLLAGNGDQVLLAHRPSAAKGKPRITSRGWEGVNGTGQTYQAYPAWRYHPTKPAVIVQNEAESDALGDEWADTPAAFAPKDDRTDT
jgi:hypothetical protein